LKKVVPRETVSQIAMRAVRDHLNVQRAVTVAQTEAFARDLSCAASLVHRAVAIKRYAPDLVDLVVNDEMRLNRAYEAALKYHREQSGAVARSSRARQERDKRIVEMAAEGYSDDDIAAALGVHAETVRMAMNKRLGIQPLSRKLGRQMHLDANRIMEGLVTAAEPSLTAAAALDWDALDPSRITAWQQRLTTAIHDLTVIRNKLRRTPRASN